MMNDENKMKRMIVFMAVFIIAGTGVFAEIGTGTRAGTDKAAETGTGAVMPEQPMPLNGSYSFLKSLMALCFVLGLIFLATYIFKKMTGLKTHGFGGLGRGRMPIHPISSMPLGDKKFLSIVEIQGKYYFLGITQNAINLLAELPQETGAAPAPASDNENPGPGERRDMDFATILHRAKQLLNRTKK